MVRSVKEIMRDSAVLSSEDIHIGGSDRESNHRYGDAYEQIITNSFPFVFDDNDRRVTPRNWVRLMMEIGVADGSSLLAWREVFPNATIVGMDIHHSDKAHGERIEFHLGDQRSLEDCYRVTAGRQFDVIVEDATHQLADSLLTLLYLWPFVRPGGLYVIEEFANIGALRGNVELLWPNVRIVDTVGPFGGVEPLVVFRKTLL